MILADKIILLRKRKGWSQEELAEQLNVTRQSVSKWEGAQSVPDIPKIIQMSEIFGVTTDYLLKDEIEAEEIHIESGIEVEEKRAKYMEEAEIFFITHSDRRETSSHSIAGLSGQSQVSSTVL